MTEAAPPADAGDDQAEPETPIGDFADCDLPYHVRVFSRRAGLTHTVEQWLAEEAGVGYVLDTLTAATASTWIVATRFDPLRASFLDPIELDETDDIDAGIMAAKETTVPAAAAPANEVPPGEPPVDSEPPPPLDDETWLAEKLAQIAALGPEHTDAFAKRIEAEKKARNPRVTKFYQQLASAVVQRRLAINREREANG